MVILSFETYNIINFVGDISKADIGRTIYNSNFFLCAPLIQFVSENISLLS